MKIKKHSIKKGVISCALAAAALSAALTLPVFSAAAAEADAAPSAADALIAAPASYTDVTPTDHLSDYPLRELKVEYFRLKMLVPELEESFSAADTNKQIHDKLFDKYGIGTKQDILNYSDYYGGRSCYLFNGSSQNNDVSMMIMYEENDYTRYIGEYARLNEDEIKDICENTDYLGTGDTVYARAIHGKTFICQVSDTADGSTTYIANTIVGGGMYSFYIDASEASQLDDNAVDTIMQSIRVRGTEKEYYGTASRLFATILAIVCALLFIVTALLCFFIYRFNAFAKAAGSSFSIIGFNLPPKDAAGEPRLPGHKNDRHR